MSSSTMDVAMVDSSRGNKRQAVSQEQEMEEEMRKQEEVVASLDAGRANLFKAISGDLSLKLNPITQTVQEVQKEVKEVQKKFDNDLKSTNVKWRSVWQQ